MEQDLKITRNGRRIPVVAFFGTKGGVGKTTIASKFAELVTRAESKPNVLIVDTDVHNRGMTVDLTRHTPSSCKTVHDYIASKNVSEVEALDLSHAMEGNRSDCGRLFFIPSSTPEADHVFEESARIGPDVLLKLLHEVIQSAVLTHQCDCVVIDCGPIIDPYTAAGATLADREFLIGQNEPISFSNMKFYPDRIREFYPSFTTGKMKLIINKVRGWDRLKERGTHDDIFHSIPFTMDIVDISEGLEASDEMKLLLFKDNIAQIVEKVFKADHPELIPPREALLPQKWESLVSNVDRLEKAPPIRRLGTLRFLLPIGILVLAFGGFTFYANSSSRHREQNRARTTELTQALKDAISKVPANGQAATVPLQQALDRLQSGAPDDAKVFNEAADLAKTTGLLQVPPVRQLPADKEHVGAAILAGGILIGGIGLVCWSKRRQYLSALGNLRRRGTKWLMAEINDKRAARKTFDNLLKINDRLDN